MGDPVTLALTAASAAGSAGAAGAATAGGLFTASNLALAGSVIGGVSSMAQAGAQRAAYEQQAANVQAASAFEIAQQQKVQRIQRANKIASFGTRGVDLSGSSSDALTRTIEEDEIDILARKYNAQMDKQNLLTQAKSAKRKQLFSGVQTVFNVGAAAKDAGMY